MRKDQKREAVKLFATISWMMLLVYIMALASSEAFADWASDSLSRAFEQLTSKLP